MLHKASEVCFTIRRGFVSQRVAALLHNAALFHNASQLCFTVSRSFASQCVAALLHNEGQLRFTMRRSFATVCRHAMRGACPTTAILFVFPLKGGALYMGGRSGRWGQKLSQLHLATYELTRRYAREKLSF